MTSIRTFLEGLIATSEKAAQISKIIRLAYLASDGVNSIATEEKNGSRYTEDFKTLADVLCQSVIDSDLRRMVRVIPETRLTLCSYCLQRIFIYILSLNKRGCVSGLISYSH